MAHVFAYLIILLMRIHSYSYRSLLVGSSTAVSCIVMIDAAFLRSRAPYCVHAIHINPQFHFNDILPACMPDE